MDTTPTRAPSSQNTTPEQTHGPAFADSGGFSQGGQIGVLNKQPSVIMFTYTLKLGPHAHTACVKPLRVVIASFSAQLNNFLPLIPTQPLIMAVSTREAVC